MNPEPSSDGDIGPVARVAKTGKVGRVLSVDTEWEQIFPHKGAMIVLDIDSDRVCYSECELDVDLPPREYPA